MIKNYIWNIFVIGISLKGRREGRLGIGFHAAKKKNTMHKYHALKDK